MNEREMIDARIALTHAGQKFISTRSEMFNLAACDAGLTADEETAFLAEAKSELEAAVARFKAVVADV